jgi:hypothetical protein
MKNADINTESLKKLGVKSKQEIVQLKKYSGVMFFLLFALVYAFMVMRINNLSNAPVDEEEITLQLTSSPALRIDEEAIKQLQTLKDNSVNVQSLFDQGRTNPFQE